MARKKSTSETGADFIENSPTFDPEQDKKRLQEELKSMKDENERLLQFQKTQELLWVQRETQDKLLELKNALERWEKTIDEVVDQIEQVGEVDESRIQEIQEIAESIIEKIESLEDMSDYDTYLPVEFRVTKDEYQKAVFEPKHRGKTQQKIDAALQHLSWFVAESGWWLNIFADSFMFLNRSLVLIQETHIDMKEGLQAVSQLDKS